MYATLEKPFILVLDSYQEVSLESEFHRAMLDALAELPAQGSIVVISRIQPPASMVRLRAEQSLQMLGWNDLRLSRGESGAIVELFGAELDVEPSPETTAYTKACFATFE